MDLRFTMRPEVIAFVPQSKHTAGASASGPAGPLVLGGELQTIELENEPAYTAVYELASPEVLVSEAWGEAVEQGRWPERVRPHTTNRRPVLLERTS